MVNLPIDIIPNTSPPKFRWRQVIDTPVGKKTVEHEGMLQASIEGAIVALVGITKQLIIENVELGKTVAELVGKVTGAALPVGKKGTVRLN